MKIRVSLLAMLLASSGFAFDWSAWEGKVALITAADGEVVVTDTTLAAALKATKCVSGSEIMIRGKFWH